MAYEFDSGASLTVVNAHVFAKIKATAVVLRPPAYPVRSTTSDIDTAQVANVRIRLGEEEFRMNVIVAKVDPTVSVLLGRDVYKHYKPFNKQMNNLRRAIGSAGRFDKQLRPVCEKRLKVIQEEAEPPSDAATTVPREAAQTASHSIRSNRSVTAYEPTTSKRAIQLVKAAVTANSSRKETTYSSPTDDEDEVSTVHGGKAAVATTSHQKVRPKRAKKRGRLRQVVKVSDIQKVSDITANNKANKNRQSTRAPNDTWTKTREKARLK